ncbi:MAG: shikimate kinase [Alphaproteobacteria bacterium]
MSKELTRPIVLVGMMGSGKSRVGRLLATRLGTPFFDADKIIEEQQGRSIGDVFSADGESAFREIEADVISALLQSQHSVISTGGGAVITPRVLDGIKDRSVSIWLQTSVEKIIPRVINDKNRPLLQCGDPKSKLEGLMKMREPFYAQADIHILNEDCSAEDTVDKIMQALNKFM